MSFDEVVEQAINQLTMMDDSFMTVVFNDNIPATELVLRIVLEREDLKVIRVRVQETLKNLRGHSLRLDILATDSTGKRYNIEFQNSSSGASEQRARYHSALLDSDSLQSGKDFILLPETYVIFITDKDVLGKGFPIYHINRFIEEDSSEFNDGSHIIYVNGECRDSTPLGKLMQDFHSKSSSGMNYEPLKQQMCFYKELKEGKQKMCAIIEEYVGSHEKEWFAEGIAEGKAAGIAEGKAAGIAEGKAAGIAEGKAAGIAEGKAAGIAEGKAAGIAEGKAAGIAEGKAAGIAEGKAAGIAEGKAAGISFGKAEGQKEIIISLLKTGVASPEQIALATCFSLDEVRSLANSLSA